MKSSPRSSPCSPCRRPVAPPAPAQRTRDIRARTAGELAELCGANPKDPQADAKINYCHGFAQGAVDVELRQTGDKKPFCFPSPDADPQRHPDRIRQLGAGAARAPRPERGRWAVPVPGRTLPLQVGVVRPTR